MNWIFVLILAVAADYGAYLTADKECRNGNGVYLIPAVGGWQWDETMTMLRILRGQGMIWSGNTGHRDQPELCADLRIRTLEDSDKSAHHVSKGDWIIRGVKGEFYACKPDIFAMTYESASVPSEIAAPTELSKECTERAGALERGAHEPR